MHDTEWIRVIDVTVSAVVQAWDLGPGESAVLSWAHQVPGTEAIVDDLAARRCARVLGVAVRGTLGLVLLAKRRGRIPLARPVIETLRRDGMYRADAIIGEALALVGE